MEQQQPKHPETPGTLGEHPPFEPHAELPEAHSHGHEGEAAGCQTADPAPAQPADPDTVSLPRRTFAGIIRLYQRYISPLSPPSCRFHPTCSEYTRQAIIKYGVVRGIGMGVIRISKCHPFHPGGYDPVP